MSRARRAQLPEDAAEYSKSGSRAAIADPTERPGQKPCYSGAKTEPRDGRNRNTKIFINIRYQIQVTEIGRKLAGSVVSRSGLEMAVRSEVRKSGSTPSSNAIYKAAVTQAAREGT